MTVREGRIGDLHHIWQIYQEAKGRGETHGRAFEFDGFRSVIFSPHHRCVVAAEGADVVGFILAYDHATWGYIDVIAVRARLRRQGIVHQMVEYVIANPNHWKTIELCHEPDDTGPAGLASGLGFTTHETFVWRIKETRP